MHRASPSSVHFHSFLVVSPGNEGRGDGGSAPNGWRGVCFGRLVRNFNQDLSVFLGHPVGLLCVAKASAFAS